MQRDSKRAGARALAAKALARGDASGWFEELYSTASSADDIPWADLKPNPNLVAWLAERDASGSGGHALKVGAGLGDDAEALAERDFSVTAFDISPTAVEWARRRFPQSAVEYCIADVLAPPTHWRGRFDFILESYTLQVLPPDSRQVAAQAIIDLLAPAGTLLVIARGRDIAEDEGAMPWRLTPDELRSLFAPLELVRFEDFLDEEEPPVRRLRAEFRRHSA